MTNSSDKYQVLAHHHAPFEMLPMSTYENPAISMKYAIEKLEEAGHECFVSSGTLLGLFRDGDFIPDDTDVDIDIIISIEDIRYWYRHVPHADSVQG
jgi:hypothetical protein